MATFTTNYNLRKPASTDFVTVASDINASMDTIDTQMKDSADAVDTMQAVFTALGIATSSDVEFVNALADLSGFTMQTGFTLNTIRGFRFGKLCYIAMDVNKTGATLAAGTGGNLSDTAIVGTLPTAWKPVTNDVPLAAIRANGTLLGIAISNASGNINLQCSVPAVDIVSGDTLRFAGFWMVD